MAGVWVICIEIYEKDNIKFIGWCQQIYFNSKARSLLNVSAKDLGHQWQRLPLIAQFVELNLLIEQTLREISPINIKKAQWSTAQGVYELDIDIVPISDFSGRFLGVNITFTDATALELK